MLHDKTIPSSNVKRLKRIKSYQKLPPFGKFAEAATRGVLWVRVFLEISKNPQENTCTGLRAATLLKKTLAQVFSCELCEISKNNFFTEHLWTTASEFVTEMLIFRSRLSQMFFKIGVLKNFAVLEPLSNKVAGFLLRNTAVVASDFLRHQILFWSWIWYLLLTVAPVFVLDFFEPLDLQLY